jgi:hypothetical protein
LYLRREYPLTKLPTKEAKVKNLNPAQILSLSRIINDKKLEQARSAAGNDVGLVVDPFTVSCEGGSISIGESVPYTPTVHLPLLDVLVIALHKAGFQRENILSMVIDAASDALNADEKVGEATKKEISFVQSEVKALQKSLSANLPKKDRDGIMKVNVKWS